MKCPTTLTLVSSYLYLAVCCRAITLSKRTTGPAKIVGLPIERKHVADPVQRDRLRRRGTIQADLDNLATLYFVNCTVGTPPQTVRLHIDTGSSDLWVNTQESSLCSNSRSRCTAAGLYSANASRTYEYVSSVFNISYVDGSGASGDYVSDTVSIGNATLDRLQFGIGYSSSSREGILGIGYTALEVQVQRARQAPYNNLPAQLVADGAIQSNAYSLYLNDLDASTGSILFGGIDTEQYSGTLQTVPVQAAGGQYAQLLITLTNLALDNDTIASSQRLPVLLDSGSSLTYLPNAIASAIYDRVGAVYSSSEGTAYVPCSLASSATALIFTFSSPRISVGMDELVIPLIDGAGRSPRFPDGRPACLFGIAPAGNTGGTIVLGDTFLRSAYVVYDLANNEIGLAQTRFNATASNILEIGTGPDAVPGASRVRDPVSATGLGNGAAGTLVGTGGARRSDAVRGGREVHVLGVVGIAVAAIYVQACA